MNVLIIAPQMIIKEDDYAEQFNTEIIQQFMQYGIEYYVVNNKNMQRMILQLSEDSIVLVYNEHKLEEDSTENPIVQNFLKKAVNIKAKIWPIAFDRESRTPTGSISNKQSYDVWEQIRCRDLDEKYLPTIARMFSRKIIARICPTCYCEKGEIFLSHRRIDGEIITAKIYDKILIQAKKSTPFRDVVNVEVGEEAQKVIDEHMKNSDVFVFIHTLQSQESEWILKELRFAMLRNIPILWVQIDNAYINKLKIKPSDKPHLKYSTKDLDNDEKLTQIVDEILEKAFELIMDRSNQTLEYIEYINSILADKLSVVDQQKMIYHVSMPRKGYHYPQRSIEQYYQIYGRTPTRDDADNLKNVLKKEDVDSIVILTNRIVSTSNYNGVVFDNLQDFCYYWDRYTSKKEIEKNNMEIVISGAFPDADEIYKQSLTDALILFTKAIIQSGYKLTFGAHPTFQELFYETVEEIAQNDSKNWINMYISECFLEKEPERKEEYNQKYTMYVTKKESDTPHSLTEMRKKMIQRKDVKALVCLGGKIKSDNKKEEGIREEIKLAREFKIPVFVVGSVGGCSSKVAQEYKEKGWNKLNAASKELNQIFLEGIDYYSMAKKMIEYINN